MVAGVLVRIGAALLGALARVALGEARVAVRLARADLRAALALGVLFHGPSREVKTSAILAEKRPVVKLHFIRYTSCV